MIPPETLHGTALPFQMQPTRCGSIAFPIDDSACRIASKAGPPVERPTSYSRKLRVIVADDERIIADSLALILNRAGFEARAVYSGEAAVEVLGSFRPDLLISDVVMTGMTGVEAAMAVRTLRPDCKVLLFSGQAATADLLCEARALGYEFEIIAKPVHPTELLAKLRTAVIN